MTDAVVSTPPVRLDRLAGLAALFAAALTWRANGELLERYSFGLNLTNSLPNWAFITDKANRSPRRGQDMEFVAPRTRYYPAGMHFVKEVAGVPGDQVTTIGRDFYVNGRFLGHAKERSQTGIAVSIGPTGVIPRGRYFVFGPNPNSLDSRYADIGWISQDRVVGVAEPVL